ILDRPEISPDAGCWIVRLGIAGMRGLRIDVDPPGLTKSAHAAIRVGEKLPGVLVVLPVGFEDAVDRPPTDSSNQLAIVDLPRRADRLLAAQPTLEAGSQVADAQQLDRLAIAVAHQVDD